MVCLFAKENYNSDIKQINTHIDRHKNIRRKIYSKIFEYNRVSDLPTDHLSKNVHPNYTLVGKYRSYKKSFDSKFSHITIFLKQFKKKEVAIYEKIVKNNKCTSWKYHCKCQTSEVFSGNALGIYDFRYHNHLKIGEHTHL